jgi:hypothetical protein
VLGFAFLERRDHAFERSLPAVVDDENLKAFARIVERRERLETIGELAWTPAGGDHDRNAR